MTSLKKKLDNTPKQVYNIYKKDGEGFDLSSIPSQEVNRPEFLEALETTLAEAYVLFRDAYEKNPTLFPNPPVFAGGFFRDIVWKVGMFPADLDLFFNSYGMEKEEAEDNLCLFLSTLGVTFSELGNSEYAGDPKTFRVFDLKTLPNSFGHVQVILKDMGPPSDDPLYVTEDFHYNHAKAALSVVGEPVVHYHGHAVFGWEQKCHVAFREKGLDKCRTLFRLKEKFKTLDLTDPLNEKLTNVANVVKDKPDFSDPLEVKKWYADYYQAAMDA